MYRRLFVPGAAAILSAVLLLAGCGRDRVITPGAAPATGPTSQGVQFLQAASAPYPLENLPTVISVPVRARYGGEVSLRNVTLQIPAGALQRDTTVTLSLLDLEYLKFRVEPTDLVLKKPVTVYCTGLRGTDIQPGSRASLAQLLESGTELVPSTRWYDRLTGQVQSFGDFGMCGVSRDGEITFIRYLRGPGYTTQMIYARLGGVIRYDRYQVTIPRGALESDTYITVRDPADGILCCELEPEGTQFRVPVELQLDLSGLGHVPYTDWTTYWFDPGADEWANIGGGFDPRSEKVTSKLNHFSKYAAGRAGW